MRGWHHRSRTLMTVAGSVVASLGFVIPAAADSLGTIWSGAYVGAQVGMSWADFGTQELGNLNTTGAAFGGYIGYNIGFGGLTFGVEADTSYENSSVGTSTVGGGSVNLNSHWNGSLRGRGGFSIGPALLYATAGWAWTGISTVQRTGVGTSVGSSGMVDGVVYGIGAETYILPPVSIRLEALRYDYGNEKLSVASGVTALSGIDRGDTVVRAGVTLHFK
jgi:outer membrane immunogenic protein